MLFAVFFVVFQTLYLASALIKFLWNTAAAAQSHMAAVQYQLSHHHDEEPTLMRKHEELGPGIMFFIYRATSLFRGASGT